eukprot:c15632_g1_i1 orf=516-1850(+)
MEEQAGLWGLSSERRLDSSSSTPFHSAACSPKSSTDRAASCFYSVHTPTCPVSVTLDIRPLPTAGMGLMMPSSDERFNSQLEESASDEFDFSARYSEADQPWSPAPMLSADELFYNGQIRPLWYNSEDLVHLYASDTNLGDDGDHFDFRSSADYKFTVCSAPHSPVRQRYVGYGCNGPSRDEGFVRPHGTVRQANKEDSMGKEDEQINKETVQNALGNSRQGEDIQSKDKKVEESRRRRAGNNREGSVRRTRSLSPLRVFHMDDDELPGQSFDSNRSARLANGDCSVEMEDEQGIEIVRMKGSRLTLKELLLLSDQGERGISNGRAGAKPQMKETKVKERSTPWFKSSPKHVSGNRMEGFNHSNKFSKHRQASMSPQGLHYASQRVQTAKTRQLTFLPYKHGLLSCLGFTSRSYRSVAGIQTFNFKSRGAKRSTGYEPRNSSKS